MSPRWNWDSPTPLAASECALPPGPKGGGAHLPATKGVGESQLQRLEKRLALSLLCGAGGEGENPWGEIVIEGSSHSRNVTNRDGEAGGYCAGWGMIMSPMGV
jgi:hypothetical protein